jgi:hypothetical protein
LPEPFDFVGATVLDVGRGPPPIGGFEGHAANLGEISELTKRV